MGQLIVMPQDSEEQFEPKILNVRELRYLHANGEILFSDLSFCVDRGERIAVLGANGAGKSTLFRLLLGLLVPSGGEIQWFGSKSQNKFHHPNTINSNERIAFIPQHHGLSVRLSVLSNVIHGRLMQGQTLRRSYQFLAHASERREAVDFIRRVGLENKSLQTCQELSGGESQRVALARALFARPSVIIADEPAASLDPSIALEMMDLLTREIDNSKCTVLFATHSLQHAFSFSDRLIVLREGRIVLDSPTRSCTETEVWNHYGC